MNEHTPEPLPADHLPDAAHTAPKAEIELSPESSGAVGFEDLRLSEALGYLFWRPAQTARLLWDVLRADLEATSAAPARALEPAPPPDEPPNEADSLPAPEGEAGEAPAEPRDQTICLRIGALAAAILLPVGTARSFTPRRRIRRRTRRAAPTAHSGGSGWPRCW